MKKEMFRDLKADEIECRPTSVKETGCSLVLYKDARVDANILDETVGAMNWQRHHLRDNANCIISIWDSEKSQWIEKEDTGAESNAQKEKGLASDSFKRSGFQWGIGRELYTSPFIWIKKADIKDAKYDKFSVKTITIENKVITSLVIVNKTLGNKVVYSFKSGTANFEEDKKTKVVRTELTEEEIKDMRVTFIKNKWNEKRLLKGKTIEQLTSKEYGEVMRKIAEKEGK